MDIKKKPWRNQDVSPDLFGCNKYIFISNKYVGNKSAEEIEGR